MDSGRFRIGGGAPLACAPMANEKRQRQKEGRLLRLEEQRAAEKRSQRFRQIRAIVLVVVAIVGVGVLISVLGSDDDSPVATDVTAPDTASDEGTADEGTTDEATTDDGTTNEPPEPEYSDPELAEEVLGREPPEPEGAPADTEPDAVETTTVIEGEGRRVQAGDLVTVHYFGVLPDGTRFDDSWSRGAPFQTTIPGQVIDGWNEGLIGARIGERLRLVIGSDKAYGETGQGDIPPDTPLVFEIDVVDAVPAEG
jgi:FKBP-type peptidyl-prolyl cis-trans isomerase